MINILPDVVLVSIVTVFLEEALFSVYSDLNIIILLSDVTEDAVNLH